MNTERRNLTRRKCNYFLRVKDYATEQVVGYFDDLSERGFKIDSPLALRVGQNYNLRLDLDDNISDSAFIAFVARSCWLKPDMFDPNLQNAGFQILHISEHDNEIYQRVVELYGAAETVM